MIRGGSVVKRNTVALWKTCPGYRNPTKLYKDDFNHVFVACQGNYGTHAAEIWKINENDEATSLRRPISPPSMDTAFIWYAPPQIGQAERRPVTYAVRDTRSGTAIASNFGQVQPPIDPTSLAVDPHTKQIYIASRGTLDPQNPLYRTRHRECYTPEGDFYIATTWDRTLLAPLSEEIRRALVKPRGEVWLCRPFFLLLSVVYPLFYARSDPQHQRTNGWSGCCRPLACTQR